MENMHTNLPPRELFELAQMVAQVDPSKVTTCVVQGGIGNVGGSERGHPVRDPGPPPRQRRPERRHHPPLLTSSRWSSSPSLVEEVALATVSKPGET